MFDIACAEQNVSLTQVEYQLVLTRIRVECLKNPRDENTFDRILLHVLYVAFSSSKQDIGLDTITQSHKGNSKIYKI